MSDLPAADRQVLADLESLNTYPHLDRRLRAGARIYTVTLWPAGGPAAVTTGEHATAGAALAEAAALAAPAEDTSLSDGSG